jgi:hypothetical protein
MTMLELILTDPASSLTSPGIDPSDQPALGLGHAKRPLRATWPMSMDEPIVHGALTSAAG